MQKTILLLLLLSLSLGLYGQKVREFTSTQLQEDFRYLKESFDKYNPALGVFHRKAAYEKRYQELFSQLDKPMTDLEFYPYIMQLSAATREGHTFVFSDTITQIFKGFFKNEFSYLPISVRSAAGRVYVWSNFSPDSTLERGAQILSINGQPMAEIVDQLSTYVIADGDIQTYRREKAIDRFISYYYWFLEKPAQFKLEVIAYGGKGIREITIPAMVRDSMIAWRNRRYGKPSVQQADTSQVYTFNIESKTAILDLNTFNRQLKDKYKVNPKRLYKEVFQALKEKKVENLVIDVRNNTGGRVEYVKHLLPYLLKKPYPDILQKNVSWKGRTSKNRFPKPKKLAFAGQLYILTNWRTFSSGSMVAVYAKEFGDAIIVGQEAGSRYEGFAAGSTQFVTLPNTKIKVGIPRYLKQLVYPAQKTKEKNRGVIPDYTVQYSIEDHLKGVDKAMGKVRKLIEANTP